MHTVPAPADGAKITERGPLAGLVTLDVTLAEQYVRGCRDLDGSTREAVVDLLRTHTRQVERNTERFLRFALDTVRELHNGRELDPSPLPPHDGFPIAGRAATHTAGRTEQ